MATFLGRSASGPKWSKILVTLTLLVGLLALVSIDAAAVTNPSPPVSTSGNAVPLRTPSPLSPNHFALDSTVKGTALIFGLGDEGNLEPITNLQALLQGDGYTVTVDEHAALPASISQYGSIWYVDALDAISSADASSLEAFVRSGHGLFLTGERPCCDANNLEDQSIVNSLLKAGSIQVGGYGDADNYYSNSVNTSAIDGVGVSPNALTTWQTAAPGGIGGVPAANVFASNTFSGIPMATGAVWDGSQLTGPGRLAILMDVNWLESSYWNQTTSSAIVQNLANFLSKGKSGKVAASAYVALGDSYSSGEGLASQASKYLPPTNTSVNQCHRDAKAYPELARKVLSYKNRDLVFKACSGATSGESLDLSTSLPYYDGNGSLLGGRWTEPGQLSWLSATPNVRLVTLTIGGNDVGFPTLVQDCLGVNIKVGPATQTLSYLSNHLDSSNCESDIAYSQILLAGQYSLVEQSLVDVYSQILADAPNARLEVLNYPQLITSSAGNGFCSVTGEIGGSVGALHTKMSFGFDGYDAQQFVGIESSLNQAIATAVDSLLGTGRIGLVDVNSATYSKALPCTSAGISSADVNGLDAAAGAGLSNLILHTCTISFSRKVPYVSLTCKNGVDDHFVGAQSLHPNSAGHQIMAATLEKALGG